MINPTNTLIIFLDGAAEGSVRELGGKTPLASATKPFIDSIAANGIHGCTDARAYTHLFTLEFLGGKERNVPRGVIEMLGNGLALGPGEVAYRLSPARLKDHRAYWDYSVSEDDLERLRQLAEWNIRHIGHLDPRLFFYGEGKGLLKVRSDIVQDLPMPPAPAHLEEGVFGNLDPFVSAMMRQNDGLVTMPWGGGRLDDDPDRAPMPSTKGLTIVSKSPSVLGVAAYFGLETKSAEGYRDGFEKVVPSLRTSNVIWHVEETDDVSHKRMPKRKVEIIEDVDRLLGENRDSLGGYRIAFIVDHGTSSVTGQHMLMKVPFAVGRIGNNDQKGVRWRETAVGFVPVPRLLETLLGRESA